MTAELTTEMSTKPMSDPSTGPPGPARSSRPRLAAVPDPETADVAQTGPGWVPGSELGCTKRERRRAASQVAWDDQHLSEFDDH